MALTELSPTDDAGPRIKAHVHLGSLVPDSWTPPTQASATPGTTPVGLTVLGVHAVSISAMTTIAITPSLRTITAECP